MVDELNDDLPYLNDLDVTWGFYLDAVLQEGTQQALAAGNATDGIAETIGSSEGGAVDASLAQVGKARTAEIIGSSQGSAADASSATEGMDESDQRSS